jgi:hypothetical protein
MYISDSGLFEIGLGNVDGGWWCQCCGEAAIERLLEADSSWRWKCDWQVQHSLERETWINLCLWEDCDDRREFDGAIVLGGVFGFGHGSRVRDTEDPEPGLMKI